MSEASTLTSPHATKQSNRNGADERPGGPIGGLLARAAEDWHVSKKSVIFICSIPLILTLIAAVCALIGKDAYKWWTGEDQFGENLQVLFWAVSFVLALIFVKKKLGEGDNIFAVMYLILSVGIVFIIGEEISWGQRVFGWLTPESLQEINKQGETNIHNIHGIGSAFKWAHLIIGAYGTFLPLIVMRSRFLARFKHQVSMLVPHFTLIPLFAFLFFWRSYRNLFEAPKKYYFAISEFSEVTELGLSIAFALFLAFQLRQMMNKKSQTLTSKWSLKQINTN